MPYKFFNVGGNDNSYILKQIITLFMMSNSDPLLIFLRRLQNRILMI